MPRVSGERSLWRHRDFLLLWSGQTTSNLGNEVSSLALPLVAGVLLKASPFELGVLAALRKLPVLFASLPAGALTDRWRKRPVMIVSFLISGCAMLTIPAGATFGWLSLWQLYAVAFVAGVCEVFFSPAYQTYPLVLLGPERLTDGVGKLTTTVSIGSMLGPALGGVLLGLLGPAKAVLADGLSYLAGAVSIALIRKQEPRPEPDPDTTLRTEIADGLRYVIRHPIIGPLVGVMSLIAFFFAGFAALEINYLVRELGWTGAQMGLVFGLSAAGGLVGGLAAKNLAGRYGTPRVLMAGAMAYPLCLTPLALVPAGLAGQVIMGVSWFTLMIFALAFQVTQRSLRQLLTPAEMQGRLAATARWLGWGAAPLGALLVGALANATSMRVALLACGAGLLLGPVWLWFTPLRTARQDIEARVKEAVSA